MFRAVVIGAAGIIAGGIATAGSVSAAPAYDVCGEAEYVTDLEVSLYHGEPQADPQAAAARAQLFGANAPAEIKTDAVIEGYAETAVLDGVPVSFVYSLDPAIQAWGDVMDWHTDHCL
ncbi:hypothetical protein [Nocardia sp. NPDC020380]|uniref:hypothetical protein n=1 Tax=Nocardia sp. NPDC020380 TaxID=3364309 RepID=UPI0037A252C4